MHRMTILPKTDMPCKASMRNMKKTARTLKKRFVCVNAKKMEITAKEAGSRPVVRGKNRSTHFLRLMNCRARSKSADLKSLVVARGRQMEPAEATSHSRRPLPETVNGNKNTRKS